MDKIILTDADGTIVNWNDAFDSFMLDKGFPRLLHTEHEYNISARFAGVDEVQAHEFIREFGESSHIAHLKPFADSVEYINKLADEGFRFIVVTSIGDGPLASINRTHNLKTLFGDVFDDIICIQMGASKATTLLKWAGKGYFWIEDHMRQAEAGYEAGLKPVLINHPYNSHYKTDLFPTVSFETPWEEVYSMIHNTYDNN